MQAGWIACSARGRARPPSPATSTPGRTTRAGPIRCATPGRRPTPPQTPPPNPRNSRFRRLDDPRPQRESSPPPSLIRSPQALTSARDAVRTASCAPPPPSTGSASPPARPASCDDADAVVLAPDPGHQQQIADTARAGVDVDVRGQDRYENLVGVPRHVGQPVRVQRRGRVHDDVRGRIRHAQLERARGSRVSLKGSDDVNRRLYGPALPDPAQRRALGIEIHEDRRVPARRQIARQIDSEGRLAGPTLGVQDDDALHDDLVLSHPRGDAVRRQAYARPPAPASRYAVSPSVSARTPARAPAP